MDSSLTLQVVLFLLFSVVLLISHEVAHLVVARAYGYPVVCVGFSLFAVGLIILDQPRFRYWSLQVLFPLGVTALVTYVALFALAPSYLPTRVVIPTDPVWQWGFSLLLAALTGVGDIMSMATELRTPRPPRDRVVRDVRFLRRARSIIRFTPHGESYLAAEFGLPSREFVAAVAGSGPGLGAQPRP